MSTWIDYAELKQRVSVTDVLRLHKVELTQRGDNLVGPCPLPCHAGDRDNQGAFSVSIKRNCFRCFTSCGSGNVIDLHARFTQRDPDNASQFREAALELNELFPGGAGKAPKSAKPGSHKTSESPASLEEETNEAAAEEENVINEPLKFTLNLKADVPFLLDEKGFSEATIQSFGLGWCNKGMLAGRIVVPIHNADGEIIAYVGRGLKEADIGKRGRWLFPKGFRKGMELFNYHRLAEYDLEEQNLVVTEGFWSAIRLSEAGIPAVALMGCEISDQQCRLIEEVTDRVWLMLDRDKAGSNAVKQVITKLAQRVHVRLAPYPDDSDRSQPEAFTPEELKASFSAV